MIIHNNFPLSEYLYYKIGPVAQMVLEIKNREDLIEAVLYLQKNDITKILPLGFGSNVLINDQNFDSTILWFTKSDSLSIKISNDLVEAFAGNVLDDIITFCFENNLIGLEWAGGLPSTVGGAVRGNIGAFGGEIKNSVEKIEVLDLSTNQFRELSNRELMFSYRDSFVKQNKNLIISRVWFRLQSGNSEEIEQAKKEYQSHREYRHINHPMDYPSCGSVFKNITKKEEVEKILSIWSDIKIQVQDKWYGKVSMGYIIKALGLSNLQVGGGQISEKHSNYIINKNSANFADVLSIINQIKEKFQETFGFIPETEIEIVC